MFTKLVEKYAQHNYSSSLMKSLVLPGWIYDDFYALYGAELEKDLTILFEAWKTLKFIPDPEQIKILTAFIKR